MLAILPVKLANWVWAAARGIEPASIRNDSTSGIRKHIAATVASRSPELGSPLQLEARLLKARSERQSTRLSIGIDQD